MLSAWTQEHMTYSLELSAMRRCLDAAQRSAIAQAAIAALNPAPAPADREGAVVGRASVLGHCILPWCLLVVSCNHVTASVCY